MSYKTYEEHNTFKVQQRYFIKSMKDKVRKVRKIRIQKALDELKEIYQDARNEDEGLIMLMKIRQHMSEKQDLIDIHDAHELYLIKKLEEERRAKLNG